MIVEEKDKINDELNIEPEEKHAGRFLAKISDTTKINAIRWWFAGAVCFFIAWGTDLGNYPLDLMLVIGLVMGIVNIFLLHPMIYSMFDVKKNGKIANKKYYERTVWEGAFLKISEILKCVLAAICVFLIYVVINVLAVNVLELSSDSVFLAVEPFVYATLYLICYLFLSFLANKIVLIYQKLFKKGN